MEISAATMESMEISQKPKNKISYNSVIPLLGIDPKKTKSLIQKKIHSYVYHNIIYNSLPTKATLNVHW